jgi:hypothetical protein
VAQALVVKKPSQRGLIACVLPGFGAMAVGQLRFEQLISAVLKPAT